MQANGLATRSQVIAVLGNGLAVLAYRAIDVDLNGRSEGYQLGHDDHPFRVIPGAFPPIRRYCTTLIGARASRDAKILCYSYCMTEKPKPKKKVGRPYAGGPTPQRRIRYGSLWDEA